MAFAIKSAVFPASTAVKLGLFHPGDVFHAVHHVVSRSSPAQDSTIDFLSSQLFTSFLTGS